MDSSSSPPSHSPTLAGSSLPGALSSSYSTGNFLETPTTKSSSPGQPGKTFYQVQSSLATEGVRDAESDPSQTLFKSEIDAAFDTIKDLSLGRRPDLFDDLVDVAIEGVLEFHLDKQELLNRLDREKLLDFLEDLRHEWSPDNKVLTLVVMLGPLHEYPRVALEAAIIAECSRIRTLFPPLEEHCDRIWGGGSLDLESRHEPDGQFSYDGVLSPPLIFEVASTQSASQLDIKIDEIYKQFPDVTVLRIDIEYKRQTNQDPLCGATITLLESKLVGETLTVEATSRVIRDKVTGQCDSRHITIPFRLMCPRGTALPSCHREKDASLRISMAELLSAVNRGMEYQALRDRAKTEPISAAPKITGIEYRNEDGTVVRKKDVMSPPRRRHASKRA